jgi:hypothetical protein
MGEALVGMKRRGSQLVGLLRGSIGREGVDLPPQAEHLVVS